MAKSNLSGLQRFLAVVQAGSLNKAAEQLHVSQPALTKSIQGLEQQLGVDLFVRGARGVSLTSYGRTVLFRARLIDAESRKLVEDVEALRDLSFGKVHVGAPPGPGFHTSILPAATLRLMAGSRMLSVNFSMGTRDQLLPMLRQGGLDFFVGVIEDDVASSDLHQEPLFEDRDSIVVRQGHPLQARRSVDLRALADYPWFVMSESVAVERALVVQALAQGFALNHSIVHSDSSQLVKTAILASDGIGLMRYQVSRQDIRSGLLHELPLAVDTPPGHAMGLHTLGLVFRRGAELSAACQQLVAEIRAGCAEDVDLLPSALQVPATSSRPAAAP